MPHLPLMEYRPSRSRVAGHGGGGHHGGGRLRGAFGLSTFDLYGPGHDESDDYLPITIENNYTVGDIGTYDSALPIFPQARAAVVDSMWTQLNPAVVNCLSQGKLSSAQATDFQSDYEGWEAFYNNQSPPPFGAPPLLPGQTFPPGSRLGIADLSTIDAWWGKALGWRNVVAQSCGSADLPVIAPQAEGWGHDAAVALESIAVLTAIGLGVWFLWPMLVGARKMGV